jgi:nitrile hydratase subunit beta
VNGIHDMGGMHGMGPVAPEADEPVFHEPWEGRVLALNRATAALGKWNIDTNRHSIERIRPADYLRMTYYEKWLTGLITRLEESGLVTSAELQSGRPDPGVTKATRRSPLGGSRQPPESAGGSSGP